MPKTYSESRAGEGGEVSRAADMTGDGPEGDGTPGPSTPPSGPSGVLRWWVVLLVGLSAVVVGGVRSWVPGLWLDEVATLVSAERTWRSLLTLVGQQDAVHALYYAIMHLWFELVGYTPFSLRLPSVLAVGATASLIVLLGNRLAGPRVGLSAGVVYMLLPGVTWMAVEGRSYAMAAGATTLAVYLFVKAIDSEQAVWWVCYSGAVLIATLLYLYAALVLVALPLALVAMSAGRRHWQALAMSSGVPALAVLPLSLEVASQSGQLDWVGPMTAGRLLASPRDMWFRNYEGTLAAIAAWVFVVALLMWFVVSTHRRHWPVRSRLGRAGIAALVTGWVVVPPAILMLVSLLGPSVYLPRHLVITAPGLALAVALCVEGLHCLAPPRRLTLLLLVAALAAAAPWWAQRTPTSKTATVLAAEAVARIDETATVDAVLFTREADRPWRSTRISAHAYPRAFGTARDLTIATRVEDSASVFETDGPLSSVPERLAGADRVVVLLPDFPLTDQSEADLASLASHGFRATDTLDVGDIVVLTYGR